MGRLSSWEFLAVGSLLGAALTACSAPPSAPLPAENVASTSSALSLSTSDAIARAEQWVAAQVPYCQSPNHQPDPDGSCSSTCERPDNADWDPYRSDCSGFVSWAWGLAAPGLTTSDFAPGSNSVPTKEIDGNSLQPGDAANIAGDHIVLFKSWIVSGTQATFIEEPGCSSSTPYAHEFTSTVEISGSQVTIAYEGSTFTAIRNPNLTLSPVGSEDAGAGDASVVTRPLPDASMVETTSADSGAAPSQDDDAAAATTTSSDPSMETTPPAEDAGTDASTATDSGTATQNDEQYGLWATSKGCSTAPGGGSSSAPGGLALVGLALVVLGRRRRVDANRRE